jgi:hypothetical protein
MNKTFALSVLVTSAIFGTAVPAQAAYVANVTETTQGVAFDGSGTLNTSAWGSPFSGNYNSIVAGSTYIVFGGPVGAAIYLNPTSFSGPSSIGEGTLLEFLPNGPGDKVGLNFSDEYLFTPQGYQSGASLAGSTVQLGATFASLGLTPGTYQWTWGDGASADSYTLNIGANAVPVPAAAWLFGSALIGLVGIKRKK